MRAVRRLDDPGHERPLDQQGLRTVLLQQVRRLHDPLAGDVRLVGGLAEQVVEVRVGAQVLAVALRVRAVEMDQRGVQPQGRSRDQHLPVVVRRGHRAQRRVDPHQVRAETGPHRHERQPLRARRQAPHHHRLVELGHLERAALPGGGEVWLQRYRVEGPERRDQFADPARGGEQTDIGAAVRHHGEIGDVRAQQRPDQGHRFAARTPAADAERHAALQPADDLVGRHRLVLCHARCSLSVPKVSRTRSATPLRLASKVKPCSKR